MNVRKHFFVGLGCIILLLATISLFFVTSGRAYSQETEFEKLLLERLQAQNVPIKSVDVVGQDPYQLEIILQSSSNETKVAPEDPSFIHAVQREVSLLHDNRDFNIDTIRISILNTSIASVLFLGEYPVTMISSPMQTANITTDALEQLYTWITGRYLDSTNVTLAKLDSSLDSYGQTIAMELSAANIDSANKVISNIMSNRWVLIEEIKEQHNLELSILKIKLFDEKEKILLDYTLDLQLQQENWWMDDSLTTEWFPNPLPADSP